MMIAGIGRLLVDNVFNTKSHNDGLVRMFEVEYGKEYRNAQKSGAHIDRQFVEEFLKTVK